MKTITKKTIAIILAALMTATAFTAYAEEATTAPAASDTTAVTATEDNAAAVEAAKKTLEEQLGDLEAKLRENEKKLASFEKDAEATEDYIDTLDEKIGYLNEELNVLDKEVREAKAKISELDAQIAPLEKELTVLQREYDRAMAQFNKLNDDFHATYNAYCLRLRAMYISGSTSVLAALLTSKDIAQFLNRYEMVKAVSKSDTELLKEVNAKMEQIITEQNGINERKAKLTAAQNSLNEKKTECEKQKAKVDAKQKAIAEKKVILSEDRAESDRLLAEYTAKSELYTEFRNEDEALIAGVNKEIDDLINGLKDPEEVTTVAIDERDEDAAVKEELGSPLYSRSNGVLNLTYPVPGHYGLSQGFGHDRNGRAHTGVDFPCPTGSKVVAAQKGIVITVKRLNYSYGYYVMIYHGTDAKGRKVVTLYAHNSSISVNVGDTVKKGQTIARSGSTGNSTGPHCHFELILSGSKVNPMNYLSR